MSLLSLVLEPQTLLIFIVTLLTFYYTWKRWTCKLPPGPFPLPVIGNMLQMAQHKKLSLAFTEWAKVYGDIFRLKVGVRDLIVISGYDRVKEALVNKGHYFKTRPNKLYSFDTVFHQSGVFWANGEMWKQMRRFTIGSLRDFGVGKKSLEERINEEVRMISDEMINTGGKPVVPIRMIQNAISNIICGIVFGNRFEYDDPKFVELVDLMDVVFHNMGIAVPENFLPWVEYFRRESPASVMIDNDKKLEKYVSERIAEHRETFDPDKIRDFIDIYLKVDNEGHKSEVITEYTIFRVILDLFLAGSETTATSISWVLLFLVTWPDVQKRCQQEIDEYVGAGRQVLLSDKPKLNYCMAVLNEVQRLKTIAPLAAPHTCTEVVKLGDYLLPKDTIVMFNLDSVHHDEKYWEFPDQFRPERWLDEQGNLLKHEAFAPFSYGARTCLGEPLARMELFLVVCNLLQNLSFSLPKDKPPPSLEGVQPGVTHMPQPYDVIITRR